MPPSGVDYASEFLNGYAPEYVLERTVFKFRFSLVFFRIDFMFHTFPTTFSKLLLNFIEFMCFLFNGNILLLYLGGNGHMNHVSAYQMSITPTFYNFQ